jgi:hypothetical protein
MAGMTRLHQFNNEPPIVPHGQPVLDADGSLLLPGAGAAVPPDVVASFEKRPGLVVLSGATGANGKRLPLVFLLKQGRRISLGRDKENDIKLADIEASRRHAEVFPGPEGFYVRDLESSNGVAVNQAKIANPYLLTHGDHIQIGGSVIFYIDLQDNWLVTDKVPTQRRSSVICARCGTVNTPNAHFCANCSAPVGAGV